MEALEEGGRTMAECQLQLIAMSHPLHGPPIPLLLHPSMSVCVCVHVCVCALDQLLLDMFGLTVLLSRVQRINTASNVCG